jgi:N utilization substance protein A
MEIPEIANGLVEIKGLAREAGSRSKVAIYTDSENIDPVGSCVGQRGVRIQTIISELGGEKVDIIEYSDDPAKFISNALAPAKITSIDIDEKNKKAIVKVAEDKLSLAIGKNGQNVRLAARLTGWKIDIFAQGEDAPVMESEDMEDNNLQEEDIKVEKIKPEDDSEKISPEEIKEKNVKEKKIKEKVEKKDKVEKKEKKEVKKEKSDKKKTVKK